MGFLEIIRHSIAPLNIENIVSKNRNRGNRGRTATCASTGVVPSCLCSLGILPSLPGSRLTVFFYRDANSALFLQLVDQSQRMNFISSNVYAFHLGRQNKILVLTRIELTAFALVGNRGYQPHHSGDTNWDPNSHLNAYHSHLNAYPTDKTRGS